MVSIRFSALVAVTWAASSVLAFPSPENFAKLQGNSEKRCPFSDIQKDVEGGLKKRLLLDPLTTPIETTGDHEFIAPDFSAGDQRGPCPGLNALANHGYISRDGIAKAAETIIAINHVYGMGLDLATLLSMMGTVWTGNPLSLEPSFSIGGKSPAVENALDNLQDLLGTPPGLIGSHNFIESDSSNTRGDTYMGDGDNYRLKMNQFMEWYDSTDEDYFTMDDCADRAKKRWDESVATNPNFYYGPYTGLVARNAGYLFASRLFRNHSVENPGGILTKKIVRNFFSVYGKEGNFEYREGHERIPHNWYKIPVDWTLVSFNLDLISMLLKYPELANVGGNMGKVNTFAGIDFSDVTGGVLNLTKLLEGNNLICFVAEIVKEFSPSLLSSLFKTVLLPLKAITDALETAILDLTCPALKDLTDGGTPLWEALLERFPGAKKAGSAL